MLALRYLLLDLQIFYDQMKSLIIYGFQRGETIAIPVYNYYNTIYIAT